MKSGLSKLEHLIYPGRIVVEERVAEAIEERIKLWSEKDPKIEWACLLCGSYTANGKEAMPFVTGYIELPAWNLNREHSLAINLNDILRISEEHHVLALLHSHPSGQLMPSAQDLATFLYCEALLGRPLLYIIASPDGQKLILSFLKCHECENSFLEAIAAVQGRGRAGRGVRLTTPQYRYDDKEVM